MSELFEKKLIYVLDDDESILVLLEKFLTGFGMQVETFLTTEAFVDGLRRKLPALCFIDLNFGPQLGAGFLLTKAMRKKIFERIILIVISSRNSSEDIAMALESGFDDYIVKPFSKAVIEQKLRQHFNYLIDDSLPLRPVPMALSSCIFNLESYLYSISENEFTILTHHLLPLNSEIEFESGFLFDILKKKIKLPVYYNWNHRESGLNASTFHFPKDDLDLKNTVAKWIGNQSK